MLSLSKIDHTGSHHEFNEHLLSSQSNSGVINSKMSSFKDFLTKYYAFIAIFAGVNMGSFNFLQYFAISENSEQSGNGMRLNYPMCIAYGTFALLFHVFKEAN